jgi:hypothetical protein
MIAATFHGPNHFVPNYDESTIEVFENIGHAISALFDRYESKGDRNLEVRYLNGSKWRVPFPYVELGDYFQCYNIPGKHPRELMDARGMVGDEAQAIVNDALTAVHANLWAYRLRLQRPWTQPPSVPESKVSVAVEKRIEAL